MLLQPNSDNTIWLAVKKIKKTHLKLKCFSKSAWNRSTGTTIKDAITAAIVPNISATPKPPNTASPARSVDARMIAAAVRKIGFARVAVA